MSRQFFDYDPMTGITQYFHWDETNKRATIESVQDIQPILDANKELAKDNSYQQKGIKNEFWHAATVPNAIIVKWKKELGVDLYNKDHWPKVKALLNSPDYRYLRTGSGRV